MSSNPAAVHPMVKSMGWNTTSGNVPDAALAIISSGSWFSSVATSLTPMPVAAVNPWMMPWVMARRSGWVSVLQKVMVSPGTITVSGGTVTITVSGGAVVPASSASSHEAATSPSTTRSNMRTRGRLMRASSLALGLSGEAHAVPTVAARSFGFPFLVSGRRGPQLRR